MPTKNRKRAMCVIAVGTAGALTLAFCGAAAAQPPPAPITGESLRIVLGSQPQASQIPLVYGVSHYAGDFGLAMNVEQNVTTLDTHTNAVQSLLDGKAEVMATSFSAILDAREQ